ncbi:Light-regulated protein 1, chloroplastic [Vitis vinifera]|uniref:Light-regulated protein 1, chloroplastic n=1 Tax=Vitis vinifera TaxID=29760 RepID=A0A438D154_VITVI|nr:Light-regulated protein 1, chloroplastic [Vitis vinifera]
MQAALSFPPSTLPLLTPTKPFSPPKNPISKLQTSPFPPLRATSKLQETPSTVDYSSTTSEACDAEMYPEVKLKAEAGNPPARSATEGVDREYLEYNSPKTVFPGEACDDLGGEFCEPEYQEGVFQEK